MQIFVNTKYDFVKWRFVAVAFSVIWVLVGIIGMLVFVAMIGGAIWLLSTAPSLSAPPPPRRPRRRPMIYP